MANKSPEQVAKRLTKIYRTKFGGKDKGRFTITRSHLRQLAGRKRLEDSTVEQIVDEAYEYGLVLTDMGDDFAVIDEDVMHRYRKVPERIILELSK